MLTTEAIQTLTPEALASLAAYHEALADQLRRRLAELERNRYRAEQQAKIDAARQAVPELVKHHLASGIGLDDACAAAALTLNIPTPSARYWYEHRQRAERIALDEAREIEIMKLAGRGWTNCSIAARVGVHPATVGRIVKRRLAG